MYRIIATVSILIRQFVLPNPFEPIGVGFEIMLFGANFQLTPEIINWMAEPILHLFAFIAAGLYYKKGKHHPVIGSLLYLLFYIIHTFLLWLMSCANFATWAVVLILVIYIVSHIGFKCFFDKCGRGIIYAWNER